MRLTSSFWKRSSQRRAGLIRTLRTIRFLPTSSSDFGGLSKIGCFSGENTSYAGAGAWADVFVGFPGIGLVASRLCLPEWSGGGETREMFGHGSASRQEFKVPASRRYH